MSKGEYAFPHGVEHLHPPVTAGMTLRDYFAAKAMQGLLAGRLQSVELGVIAGDCYKMADVMLKARQE